MQPGSSSRDRSRTPDYQLFDPNQPDQPIACCNAYAWDRNLDGLVDDERDPEYPNENPGSRVIGVLENEANPEWAIVTNGKFWRLYTRRAHSRAANYYEIDLEEALASPEPGLAFRYFWLFFRSTAFSHFSEGDEKRGRAESFLAWLMAECNQYARQLETRLKERVFEEIFPHFAKGFITHMGGASVLLNLPAVEREQKLLDTFHGTLTFLYRLLFLFYAESRNLLPASEVRGYWEISLSCLKKEIADKAGPISDDVENKLKLAYPKNSYELYDRLSHLFHVIDLGESARNVPTYNGGLFVTDPDPREDTPDAANARFLATHKIPDRALALGLDHMSRDIDARRGDLVMIDYKSLGVQQLGSIYEGLLEFKLRLASEKMAVVRGKKTEEIVPYAEAQKNKRTILRKGRSKNSLECTLQSGEVYLENDRSERKATGSYYTPDYIVKYIVRNTVGPALDEKFETLRPRLREAQKAYFKAVERKKQFIKIGQAGDDPMKTFNTPESQALVDDFFDLRVLDPAMGSGHFLVEAVDFITDRMVAFLNAFPHNPITHALRRARQTILEEMHRQDIAIDQTFLTDVNLLKRHVLKRCIYGVDINHMVVELAKVSLWLHCFTTGAPLSFLDHHLKQGNSLIGVWKLEDHIVPGSGRWNDLVRTLTNIVQISKLTDSTAGQVKESHALYRASQDSIRQTRERLNTDIATHFADIGDTRQAAQVAYMTEDQKSGVSTLTIEKFKLAQTIARERNFFHWKLEFPEIFVDLERSDWKKNPGFDSIIGNPPYIRIQKLSYDDADFFKQNYLAAYRRVDIAALFLEQSIRLLSRKKIVGMILSSQFMTADYGQKLREYLLSNILGRIFDLKDLPVFDDALTYVCIFIGQKIESDKLYYVDLFENELKNQPSQIPTILENAKLAEFPKSNFSGEVWQFENYQEKAIFEKMRCVSDELGAIGEARTGLFTGLDEVMMIYPEDEDRLGLEKEILLPVASGTEPDRYYLNPPYKKVIYPYKELNGATILLQEQEFRAKYPITYSYLLNFKTQLESRKDSRRNFSENKTWYQLTRYGSLSLFRERKILTPGEVNTNSFCLDEKGIAFSVARVFAIISNKADPLYLLAILNSKLLEYQLRKISSPKQGGYSAYSSNLLEKAYIRKIIFNTPAQKRKALVRDAITFICTGNDAGLLSFISDRLNAQPEECDVIHDLLVHLAKQMNELNKQKQIEMSRLLTWLEGTLQIQPNAKTGKVGLDTLTPKDRLKNYLGDYQKNEPELSYTELENILERNNRKLGVSLNDTRFTTRLRQEFKASLAVLRPIKERLAWTDWLIDQIVYKLYGLTEEEIQVIAGSQNQPPAPRSQPAEGATERIVLANTADAALFLDVLQELAQNERSLVELASRLSARNPVKNIPSSLVEEIARELRSLGWVEQKSGGLRLATGQVPPVLLEAGATAQQLHLELALAHERKTQAVSKLLNRLLALAPKQQGALVIPEPEVTAPADVRKLSEFIQKLIIDLVQKLEQDYPATRKLLHAERLAQDALAKLTQVWNTMPPSKRNSRLAEVIRDGFAQAFFDPLSTPKELVFTWAPRLAQAGLWMWARRLYGTAGLTLFPVGTFFSDVNEETGKPIPPAPREGFKKVSDFTLQTYQLHDPQDNSFTNRFVTVLFDEVQILRGPEQHEYVSLLALRDRVCYRLRIGNPIFERRLAEAVSLSVSRQIPYSLSIEPDRTWEEQSSREMELPVIINGPRYIISMKERVSA